MCLFFFFEILHEHCEENELCVYSKKEMCRFCARNGIWEEQNKKTHFFMVWWKNWKLSSTSEPLIKFSFLFLAFHKTLLRLIDWFIFSFGYFHELFLFIEQITRFYFSYYMLIAMNYVMIECEDCGDREILEFFWNFEIYLFRFRRRKLNGFN